MKSAAIIACALVAPMAASAQEPLPSAHCAGWQGERVCALMHEDAMIRVLRCTFPPGVGHEAHYHPPHFGYALSGESVMRIVADGRAVERPVRAGAPFVNDVEVRHEALNVGSETMAYLIVEKKYADRRSAASVAPGLCEN